VEDRKDRDSNQRREEMIQQVPIKCPRCGNMVDALKFWMKVGDSYFHVCEQCCKDSQWTTEEILQVGFWHGYEQRTKEIYQALQFKGEKA